MNNYNFVLLDISKSLQRIAKALEESNNMIKDLGGKMITKKELMRDVCELFCQIDDLQDLYEKLDKRIKKLEPKKEKRSAKKVSK